MTPTPIKDFCKERMLNSTIEEAFTTYVRASYSSSYAVKGDTLSRMLEKMTPEKVEHAWHQFVLDYREILPERN